MARRTPTKPKPRTRRLPPNLPQHNLPPPYARLLSLGEGEFPDIYLSVADVLKQSDAEAGVAKLLEMVQDISYYEYWDEEFPEEDDLRCWTRLHALRTIEEMGEHAHAVIEPLLPMLNEEDDEVREEMPSFYGKMGRPAIAPLLRTLQDTTQEEFLRGNAADSLAEIVGKYPDTRDEIIPLLENALDAEKENEFVAAEIVCALLDAGAKESLNAIQRAFEEDRVDQTIVEMIDVEEHFGLREPGSWELPPEYRLPTSEDEAYIDESDELAEEKPAPFVAAPKVGRNEPCPCGSGKKYKKCCGA